MHFYKVTQSWHFLCVHSGTYWSQTYQPLWPLGSCVRRWEQCAALPSSSPSHSSGLMMKVDVPCCKILHLSLCALSCMLWPFHTSCLTLAHFQGFWPIKNSSLQHHTSHWNYMVHCEHWQSQNIVITLPELLYWTVCPVVSFLWVSYIRSIQRVTIVNNMQVIWSNKIIIISHLS